MKHAVIVMYSGGADSALSLVKAIDLHGADNVAACYVDFLGQATRENKEFVVGVAAKLGVKLYIQTVDVQDHGKGPEGNARQYFKFVLEYISTLHPDADIWIGHNKDDHIETVLIQLFRGAGDGTKGIPDMRQGKIFRPVLYMTRDNIRAECMERGVLWYDDPMNEDTNLTRVFFREQIIPRLKEHYGEKSTYTRINTISSKFKERIDHE